MIVFVSCMTDDLNPRVFSAEWEVWIPAALKRMEDEGRYQSR